MSLHAGVIPQSVAARVICSVNDMAYAYPTPSGLKRLDD